MPSHLHGAVTAVLTAVHSLNALPVLPPTKSKYVCITIPKLPKLLTGRRLVISSTGALPAISMYSFLHSPQETGDDSPVHL